MTKKAIILFDPNSGQHKHQWYKEAAEQERARYYCRKRGLEIYKLINFFEPSYSMSKHAFTNAIDMADKFSETLAIVTDKVSRLQYFYNNASLVDKLIREGKLELHFYDEEKAITNDTKPEERMGWDIFVLMASCYNRAFEECDVSNWEDVSNTDDIEADSDNDSLLDLQFEMAKEIFHSLSLEPQKLPKIVSCLKFASEMEQGATNQNIRQLQTDYSHVKDRMDNITDEFLNSDITRKDYLNERKGLARYYRAIIRDLIKHTKAEDVFSDCLTDMAELSYNAAEGFKHSTIEEKRELMKLVFEQIELRKSKLEYKLSSSARLLLKYKANS